MENSYEKRSSLHPTATWEECIELIKKINEKKMNKVAYIEIAKEYGLSSYTTRNFTRKISAAKQFGLIETEGATVKLTDTAKSILYPTGDNTALIKKCFATPLLYKKLIQRYNGKALPNMNTLSNILLNDYNITKTGKDYAAKVFVQNAESMGILKGGVISYDDNEQSEVEDLPDTSERKTIEQVLDERSNNANETLKEVKRYTDNNSSIYEEFFTMPTSCGKSAKIYIPDEISKEEAILFKSIIDSIFKSKYGV